MEKITITVKKDLSCEMAHVYDNVGNGMEGNFWDFHNGCHGMYNFNEFNTVEEFVYVLKDFHEESGKSVEIIRAKYVCK